MLAAAYTARARELADTAARARAIGKNTLADQLEDAAKRLGGDAARIRADLFTDAAANVK